MKFTSILAFVLVIIGALNWFMIGIFSFDLVAAIFGAMTVWARIIYALVGLAGIYMIFFIFVYKPFKSIVK